MRRATASILDWRESETGELVAFENGQCLDRPHDANSVRFTSDKSKFVILGLGSGFLLDRLTEQYPHFQFTIIDSRESLVSLKRKSYSNIDFVVVQTIEELISHPDYCTFLSPEFGKILFKSAAGAQLSFFQEIFWNLNLRTTEALSHVVSLEKPMDDRWLINAKQLLESVKIENLPYKTSEVLAIQELIK